MIGLTTVSIRKYLQILNKEKYGEPVPSYEELDLAKLASTLKTPFLRSIATITIPTSILKTIAHFFCLMVESHYAPNGNKRLAVISLYSILKLNGYVLKTSNVKLYAIAMAVTWLSKYGLFDQAVEEVFLMLKDETQIDLENKIDPIEKKKLETEFVRFMQSKS